eukprot:scpid42001/ scgid5248/ 
MRSTLSVFAVLAWLALSPCQAVTLRVFAHTAQPGASCCTYYHVQQCLPGNLVAAPCAWQGAASRFVIVYAGTLKVLISCTSGSRRVMDVRVFTNAHVLI